MGVAYMKTTFGQYETSYPHKLIGYRQIPYDWRRLGGIMGSLLDPAISAEVLMIRLIKSILSLLMVYVINCLLKLLKFHLTLQYIQIISS